MAEKRRSAANSPMSSGTAMKSEGMYILMNNIVIGHEHTMQQPLEYNALHLKAFHIICTCQML